MAFVPISVNEYIRFQTPHKAITNEMYTPFLINLFQLNYPLYVSDK